MAIRGIRKNRAVLTNGVQGRFGGSLKIGVAQVPSLKGDIESNMVVAMANHNQPTGGWSPIGKSAIWSSSGLLARADERQNALVVAENSEQGWTGWVIDI